MFDKFIKRTIVYYTWASFLSKGAHFLNVIVLDNKSMYLSLFDDRVGTYVLTLFFYVKIKFCDLSD